MIAPGLVGALSLAAAVLLWPARVRPDEVGDSIGSRWSTGSAPGDTAIAVPVETALSVAVAVDLLALALTCGVPMTVALESVADRSGPVVCAHLRQVSAALQWGVDAAKAWEGLPAPWRPVGAAIALAGEIGVPAAGMLRESAKDLRASERQRLQERTARLGVLIVLPLGGCFLPAFAVLTVLPVVGVIAVDVLHGG